MNQLTRILIFAFLFLSFTSKCFPQSNPEMDLIMLYDIDHGSLINERSDNGWMPLNPEYPDDPVEDGHFRTTTSLLGTYESQDSMVIKQHAYWIKALGCNVFCNDLTNVESPIKANVSSNMIPYYIGVIKAFELQLKGLAEITEFEAPTAYPALRLFESNVDDFVLMLEEMDNLYQKYPEKWYKLDDGTENSDLPFITIFTDWNLLSSWAATGIPQNLKGGLFDKFNIRWSNGFLRNVAGVTEHVESNDAYKIPGSLPYWLFIENRQTSDGYYETVYKETPDGQGVEQMITWASVWNSGSTWDGLRDLKDGKLPIERYTEPVFDLLPKTLLVNRFNYPLAWLSQPQEGVSRNKSTHIEPNVDWGFLEFNDVANVLYDVKGSEKNPPSAPVLKCYDVNRNTIEIKLDGFPLEYRMSNNIDFSASEWNFLNVGNEGISLRNEVDRNEVIYMQTRNSFGESQVGTINISSGNSWYIIDDISNSIDYSSGWEFGPWDGYYNNSCHYTWVEGEKAEFTFIGSGIKLIGTTNVDKGKAAVFLDGVFSDTVDFYGSNENQVVMFVDSTLSDGKHTIEIEVSGKKRTEAVGSYVFIDAFEVKQLVNTISFIVTDEDGGIEDATIEFDGKNINTNVEGIAKFTDILPADKLQYSISKDGYKSKDGNIDVYKDDIIEINLEAWEIIPLSPWTRVDDTCSSISYTSHWETGGWSGYFNETCHYTWEAGQSLQYAFNGSAIKLIGARNIDKGKAAVFIDGVFQDTIDFYGPSELQVVVFADSSLSEGEHIVEIEVTGKKRNEASGTYVFIDAFEIKQYAFNHIMHRIPGRIEAENFDLGGEGSAYHDSEASNIGGEYRPLEGVDIQGGTYDGGYHVGWTAPGEWLEYTIKKTNPGVYNVYVDVACPVADNPTNIFLMLDNDTLGNTTLPNTGNWMDFQRILIPDVQLSSGKDNILRLFMDGGDLNINYIEFEALSLNCTEQTIDFTAIDNKFTNDQAFELTATASSELPVAFELISGPATLNNNSLLLNGEAGEVKILAWQNGDDVNCWAEDVVQSFSVFSVFNIVFSVSNAEGALDGVSIEFNGTTLITGEDGVAEFSGVKPENGMNYSITKDGYQFLSETIDVNEDLTVPVTLIATTADIILNTDYNNVFPNPNNGAFRISNITGSSEIKIYNIQGSLVYYEKLFCDKKVNTNLQAGIYLIEIDNGKWLKMIVTE